MHSHNKIKLKMRIKKFTNQIKMMKMRILIQMMIQIMINLERLNQKIIIKIHQRLGLSSKI